jgi:hypothetical protein
MSVPTTSVSRAAAIDPLAELDSVLREFRGEIIDMHVHPSTDVDEFEAVLDQGRRAGIGHIIFSHLGIPVVYRRPTPAQTRTFNEFAAGLRDRHAGWVDMYVAVDPRQGESSVRDVEDGVLRLGAVGVKMEWCRADDGSLEPIFPILDVAGKLGVPVKIHTFFRKGGEQMGEVSPLHIRELAQRFPGTNIIMAHSGGDWIRAARTVKALPNVFGDTSGCTWRAGFTEFFVQEMGAERVLYGSDAPVRAFGPQIAKILAAGGAPEALRLMFVDNARRLFFRDARN